MSPLEVFAAALREHVKGTDAERGVAVADLVLGYKVPESIRLSEVSA